MIGGKKVLVGGCFDLLHYGHITFLKQAWRLGTHLVVALEADDAIASKGRPVIHSQQERREILLSLKMVHEVIDLPSLSTYGEYLSLVKEIAPHIIAVTEGDPYLDHKQRQAQEIGAKVRIVTPLLPGYSSSGFFKRVC
jgi:FAD synthetase